MIPYTTEPRADTGVSNVTLGIWLFLASEVMLFGALFSSYALLRVAAPDWPHGPDVLDVWSGVRGTVVLLAGTAVMWRARARPGASIRSALWIGIAGALLFVAGKGLEWQHEIAAGLLPSTSTFFAVYFTLTGFHVAHVLGGIVGNLWVIAGARRVGPVMTQSRVRALTLYWAFVDVIWIVIFALLYLS